ncbi:MAG: ABC transporter ATP-binding protein, partial [Anaerovoracaceae bacterium]
MIRLKNVSKFYYSKGMIASGFSKVNLEFKVGEFVVITGESGSGKSTLLNVISGLDTYEEGELYIDGKETSHYTTEEFEEYRKKYIGNIFQNFNLVNSYSVYQNVELILLINGYTRTEIKDRVTEIIQKVGLREYTNTKVSKLSGGQKQRVAIARALAKETSIIVADEPTGNLDSTSAAGIVTLLREIAKDKLVVVVTHNFDQFADSATRIIKMHDGKVVEDKVVAEGNQEIKIAESRWGNISVASKLRLGIRNTFNVIPKFLLLLVVFMFVILAVSSNYTSFQKQEEEMQKLGYNPVFS